MRAIFVLVACVLLATLMQGCQSQSAAPGGGVPAVLATIQFDNSPDRVTSNQDVIIKYVAEKLCNVPFTNVQFLEGSLEDQGTTFDSKTIAKYYCKVPQGDVNSVLSHCQGWYAQHELKDEIKDHTTPDIEVEKTDCAVTST